MIITTAILKEKYHDYANPLDKIKQEVDKGNLIRLINGIYETDKEMGPCLLASSIFYLLVTLASCDDLVCYVVCVGKIAEKY